MSSVKFLKFGSQSIAKVGNNVMGYNSFSPTNITNCVVWLDNDPSNFIFSTGSKISRWTDKSGLNNHYIQNSSSLQPLFVSNGINGHNGIYFSNSSDNYLDSILNTTYPQPFTVFTVWNLDNLSTGITPVVYDNVPGSGSRVALYWGSNQIAIGSSILVNAYSKNRPFSLIQNMVEYNGNNTRVFENGILKSTVSSGTSSLTSFRLGHAFTISPNNRISGYICEKIVFSRSLTNSEITLINNYLNNKYGL